MLEILNRWKKGDFSAVDRDHNIIWNIQDGSVGEAKGIMTKEQEEQFIEDTFRNTEKD